MSASDGAARAGAIALALLALGRPRAVRERGDRDQGEQGRRDGVADEQQVVGLAGEDASERQAARESDVDHHPVDAERRHPRLGRDQIRNERARRRAIELAEEAEQQDDEDDRPQSLDPHQRQREGRSAQHREHDRVPPADPVGEQPADGLGSDRAQPVAGEAEPRLRHGVPAARQVQRDERQHERAEPVDERADEQDPDLARQPPKVLPQGPAFRIDRSQGAPPGPDRTGTGTPADDRKCAIGTRRRPAGRVKTVMTDSDMGGGSSCRRTRELLGGSSAVVRG